MYCSKCGKELEDGIRFCPYCGQSTQNINVKKQKNVMLERVKPFLTENVLIEIGIPTLHEYLNGDISLKNLLGDGVKFDEGYYYFDDDAEPNIDGYELPNDWEVDCENVGEADEMVELYICIDPEVVIDEFTRLYGKEKKKQTCDDETSVYTWELDNGVAVLVGSDPSAEYNGLTFIGVSKGGIND